jgi:hypothetical protein
MQYNFDRDGLVSSESPSFWTLVSGTTYGFGRIEHSLQIFTSPRKHRLLLCGLIQKQGSNICHTLVGYTYPRVEGTSCFPFRAFRSLSEPHPLPTVTLSYPEHLNCVANMRILKVGFLASGWSVKERSDARPRQKWKSAIVQTQH